MKSVYVLGIVSLSAALFKKKNETCADNTYFTDDKGNDCNFWLEETANNYGCKGKDAKAYTTSTGQTLSKEDMVIIRKQCPEACRLCGLGGYN